MFCSLLYSNFWNLSFYYLEIKSWHLNFWILNLIHHFDINDYDLYFICHDGWYFINDHTKHPHSFFIYFRWIHFPNWKYFFFIQISNRYIHICFPFQTVYSNSNNLTLMYLHRIKIIVWKIIILFLSSAILKTSA